MTTVEKAAYLKGLIDGLGLSPDSRDGKLWNALSELMADIAHQQDELQKKLDSHEETLDDLYEQITFVEELALPSEPLDDVDDEDYEYDFTDDEENADDENRALVIKMSWVRNAVAIAAAIACFFLLATPVANSDLGNKTMSQLQGNIIYKLMPKDSNMTPVQTEEVKEVKEVREVNKVNEDKQDKAVEEVKAIKEDKVVEKKEVYCIVLASQVKRSNAEEYVNKLKQRGISDARICVNNGTLRVVCGAYDNQSQAYSHLNKMSVEDEFAEAWVYKIKD